jgi:hypothetical protein
LNLPSLRAPCQLNVWRRLVLRSCVRVNLLMVSTTAMRTTVVRPVLCHTIYNQGKCQHAAPYFHHWISDYHFSRTVAKGLRGNASSIVFCIFDSLARASRLSKTSSLHIIHSLLPPLNSPITLITAMPAPKQTLPSPFSSPLHPLTRNLTSLHPVSPSSSALLPNQASTLSLSPGYTGLTNLASNSLRFFGSEAPKCLRRSLQVTFQPYNP